MSVDVGVDITSADDNTGVPIYTAFHNIVTGEYELSFNLRSVNRPKALELVQVGDQQVPQYKADAWRIAQKLIELMEKELEPKDGLH